MTDLEQRFRVTHNLDHGEEPIAALFQLRRLEAPLRELRSEHWATSARSLAVLGALRRPRPSRRISAWSFR